MPTPSEYQAAVTKSVTNMDRINRFVNGATDETVATDNGSVPTLAGIVVESGNAAESAAVAEEAKEIAVEAKDLAVASAQTAAAFGGPLYPSIAAGLAATTNGQEFLVNNGDFTGTIYLNNGGSAVLRRVIILDPRAPVAASTIGTATTQTVQQAFDGVTTRTAMKALIPAAGRRVYLSEPRRRGSFVCVAGTPPVADTLEGRYVVSNTAGFYWEREWDGTYALAEWFGAQINNGLLDSGPAIQACLDVFGRVFLLGDYYGSIGLNGNGKVIRGFGPLAGSAYFCSSPTANILSNRGTPGNFAAGGDFDGFSLIRTVTPTTPANPANDRTQGHGLSLDMVSNPIVKNVYTENNLVECYLARSLSPKLDNIRGLYQATFPGGARWTGLYVWGDPAGMGAPWETGPSGNPSARLTNFKMGGPINANATCFRLEEHLQDLWLEGNFEAAGGGIQFDINPNGKPCSDAWIEHAVCDGYLTNGMRIRNMPIGSTYDVKSVWLAPRSGATGHGIEAVGAHGVSINATGNFLFAPATRGISISDSTSAKIIAKINNSERPVWATSLSGSNIEAFGLCDQNGTDAGAVITSVGGGNNRMKAFTVTSGTKQFVNGIGLDSSAANNYIDVSGVRAADVTGGKFDIAGTPITTQGNRAN